MRRGKPRRRSRALSRAATESVPAKKEKKEKKRKKEEDEEKGEIPAAIELRREMGLHAGWIATGKVAGGDHRAGKDKRSARLAHKARVKRTRARHRFMLIDLW